MSGQEDTVQVQTQLSTGTVVEVKRDNFKSFVEVSLGSPTDPVPLSAADGQKLVEGVRTAKTQHIPLICNFNSTGAPPDSGVEALDGWGKAAQEITASSGIIPIIFCVKETALAGPALLLGLADFVIMVKDSYSYVSGPRMVQEFTGVPIDPETLGGAAKHAQMSGLASFVVPDLDSALEIVDELLSLLPSSSSSTPPNNPTTDPADRLLTSIENVVPDTQTGSYDMREIIAQVSDDQILTEIRKTGLPTFLPHYAQLTGTQLESLQTNLNHLPAL